MEGVGVTFDSQDTSLGPLHYTQRRLMVMYFNRDSLLRSTLGFIRKKLVFIIIFTLSDIKMSYYRIISKETPAEKCERHLQSAALTAGRSALHGGFTSSLLKIFTDF